MQTTNFVYKLVYLAFILFSSFLQDEWNYQALSNGSKIVQSISHLNLGEMIETYIPPMEILMETGIIGIS